MFLGHHDVTPHMLVRDPRRDPGHELLDLATELHCGLLVMGCFGHSKLRELCLGGASRPAGALTGFDQNRQIAVAKSGPSHQAITFQI